MTATTVEAAAIEPTAVESTSTESMTKAPAVPRTYSDENPIREIARSPVTIRGTGVGIVAVVAIRTDRRRTIVAVVVVIIATIIVVLILRLGATSHHKKQSPQ
jgi:hypothetical protein